MHTIQSDRRFRNGVAASNVIPFPSQVRRAHPAQDQERPDFNGLTAELIVKQFREGTMPEALLRYLLALVWP
jgi:hypothetical protein